METKKDIHTEVLPRSNFLYNTSVSIQGYKIYDTLLNLNAGIRCHCRYLLTFLCALYFIFRLKSLVPRTWQGYLKMLVMNSLVGIKFKSGNPFNPPARRLEFHTICQNAGYKLCALSEVVKILGQLSDLQLTVILPTIHQSKMRLIGSACLCSRFILNRKGHYYVDVYSPIIFMPQAACFLYL